MENKFSDFYGDLLLLLLFTMWQLLEYQVSICKLFLLGQQQSWGLLSSYKF